jgi:hypothetical protein
MAKFDSTPDPRSINKTARDNLAKELDDALRVSEKDPESFLRSQEATWKSIRDAVAGYVTGLKDGSISRNELSYAMLLARKIKQKSLDPEHQAQRVHNAASHIFENAAYQEILNQFWGVDHFPLTLDEIEMGVSSWLEMAPDTFEASMRGARSEQVLTHEQLRMALDEIGPLFFEEYWDTWKLLTERR